MRDLSWKVLKSEYVFKDRWFIARADSCKLPDGRIIEPYYVLEFPNWCNVVLVTEDEKIVFVSGGLGISSPDFWVRKMEKIMSTTIPPT